MTLFRSTPNRIYYGTNRSAAVYDEYAVAVGVAAGILGLAWLCVWPTCKRKRQTALVSAAYFFCIFVFVVTIRQTSTYKRSYAQSGSVLTSSPYAAYSNAEVNGTVGLWMGLTSFNATLRGEPEFQNITAPVDSPHAHSSAAAAEGRYVGEEQINYNEIIEFGTRQGRPGFDEYGNRVNQEYRRMQGRGLPYPIAWAIELFTNDGDDMRWGRKYRVAGYYAHVALWTTVPLWTITLATLAAGLWGISASFPSGFSTQSGIGSVETAGLSRRFLLKSQLLPSAVLCACTGVLLVGAPSLYAAILSLSPGGPVSIPFASGDLELRYGWCFWLTGATGVLVLALGVAGILWCTWGYSASLQRLDCVWEGAVQKRPRTCDQKQERHTLSVPNANFSTWTGHARADGKDTIRSPASNGLAKDASPSTLAPPGCTPAAAAPSAQGNCMMQRAGLSPTLADPSQLSFPSFVQLSSPAIQLTSPPTPLIVPAMSSSVGAAPSTLQLAQSRSGTSASTLQLQKSPLAPIQDLTDEAEAMASTPTNRPKDATIAAAEPSAAAGLDSNTAELAGGAAPPPRQPADQESSLQLQDLPPLH